MPGPIVTDRTPTASVERWQKYDRQTLTQVSDAGARAVDHAGSARANVTAATDNLRKALTLDRFESSSPTGMFGSALKVALAPWRVAGEVADVVTAPAKIGKDATDAVAHAIWGRF